MNKSKRSIWILTVSDTMRMDNFEYTQLFTRKTTALEARNNLIKKFEGTPDWINTSSASSQSEISLYEIPLEDGVILLGKLDESGAPERVSDDYHAASFDSPEVTVLSSGEMRREPRPQGN